MSSSLTPLTFKTKGPDFGLGETYKHGDEGYRTRRADPSASVLPASPSHKGHVSVYVNVETYVMAYVSAYLYAYSEVYVYVYT